MPPLRIGVNALYLIPGGVGGTEVYLRNLLAALARIDTENRYYVFTNRETASDLVPPGFVHVPQRVPARYRPARILWEQTLLPVAAARLDLDVLLNPGFTAPILSPCPCVTVFHDLQHKRHPEYFRWFDLPFWRVLLFLSAQLSDIVLAVSEATAADLRRYYRLDPGKVRIVREGVAVRYFGLASQRRCAEPLLLCVSTLHPHKNLDRLLEAFAVFRRRHPAFRLVVVGMRGFHAAALERRREALGLTDAVEFTGWIDDAGLDALYTRALAFIYPSTFEGFGLPVLEAMAAGIPVACADIPPLGEIAGEAALRFDPADTTAIENAMTRLAGDAALRARLAVEGPRRAALFPWAETARATREALIAAARPV